MRTRLSAHLFLLGRDYHLGDLLSFTAVLAAYRRQIRPEHLVVGYPDPLLGRILEHNPLIDEPQRVVPMIVDFLSDSCTAAESDAPATA